MQRRCMRKMWGMGDVYGDLVDTLHIMGREQWSYYYMRENLRENAR
jgi:hypothetical protein